MRRNNHFFSISFLDILIAFMSSILFMFITVDKGSGAVDLPDTLKGTPTIYAELDTTGILHHITYHDSVQIELGTPYVIMVKGQAAFPRPECPEVDCPELDCSDCEFKCDCEKGIICTVPEHHKFKACPDPKVHELPTEKAPVDKACNRLHCEDDSCDKKQVVKIIPDPISLPYQLGFAIYDLTSINRDIDLRVCSSRGGCVDGARKRQGTLRWVDLNRRLFPWDKSVVTGGEVIISYELQAGIYTIEAKYDKVGKASAPPKTTAEVVIATKGRKGITSQSKQVELVADADWKPILKAKVDEKGNIKLLN
jgi:hypothetical protein